MNIEALKNAGIDYDGGVKRFMGRAQLYTKTLSKFPGDDTMVRIRRDYKAGDLAALLQDVHEFKGMCGNMSMTRLAHTADVMVTMLRSETIDIAGLETAMESLNTEYTAVRDAILIAAEVSQ